MDNTTPIEDTTPNEDMLPGEDVNEPLLSDISAEETFAEEISEATTTALIAETESEDLDREFAPDLQFAEEITLSAKVEAIVFAAPKPIRSSEVAELLLNDGEEVTTKQVEAILRELYQQYQGHRGGFHLVYQKGDGFQFQTVPAAAPIMERLFSERPRPLSRASLETLSIIAYRQPVTRADVEYIRGVDAGNIIKGLMDRGLVACVGRREDAGRPMVFGTTDEFLKVFRLAALGDLPPLSSFQPAPDLIAQAQEMLANRDESVDVEAYIADLEKAPDAISGGVLDSEENTDFIGDESHSSLRFEDETPAPPVLEDEPLQTSSAENEVPQNDSTSSSDTKMAFSAGSGLEAGSREDDTGGEDLT